jgi:hypothetical protein
MEIPYGFIPMFKLLGDYVATFASEKISGIHHRGII